MGKVSRLWELSQTAAIYFRNMLPFQRDNSPPVFLAQPRHDILFIHELAGRESDCDGRRFQVPLQAMRLNITALDRGSLSNRSRFFS